MNSKRLNPVFYWDLEDDIDGNLRHIALNGLTPEDVESVFASKESSASISRSSGRPMVFGWTSSGKHIAVAYDEVNDEPLEVYVITAYEVEP